MNILVTGGAGTGVGSGICQALYEAGAKLLINDIRLKELQIAQNQYPGSLIYHVDLENQAEVTAMFDQIEKDCGGCTGLVNNAGIGLSKFAHEVTEEEFEHLFGVNVRAVWRTSKYFAQRCIKRKVKGHIVNISSIHAHSTTSHYSIYCSAKNAVLGLTLGMAADLGSHGMRVNAVSPGYVHAEQNYDLIKTRTEDPERWVRDLIQNQQMINIEIKPIDIGQMVAFLLSDLARCITAQNIHVDNGTTGLLFNRDFS